MHVSKLLLVSLFVSSSLFAQDIKMVGTIDKTLPMPQRKLLAAKSTRSHIKLLKMQLSKSAITKLNQRAATILKKSNTLMTTSNLPSNVQLGMSNVPVLDQGPNGSCVTFATTAALDAAINKGDYVSQLCQLQLGSYLEKNGYVPSGWNGSLGRLVLSQIEQFGFVNKEKQITVGCGGLTEYPGGVQPSTDMSLKQFHQLSESINNYYEEGLEISWSPLLDIYQTFMDRTDTNKILFQVKNSLNQKDRVIFGVFLLDFDLGLMGAVGTHNSNFDTWVLTTVIARDLYLSPNFGGHEMVITGYDDNATAIDDEGQVHKGLLTLRNSWGKQYGDKGNFYMSYDYFKVLVIEAQRITNMKDEQPENPDAG